MPYELIAILMFSTMMLMLMTGQRVFGAIGFVAVLAALLLWGDRGGYVLSESRIADDLYRMFHVWMGGLRGGLAIGTIGLMVLISAMNGLSVAGMAIGATIALPELLRRAYDKRMVTGVIQAGSSLGILVPPSVVLVLYAMIARQPVGQLWLAGVIPGLMMAAMFILYIAIRCWKNPDLGPALDVKERDLPMAEKLRLLRAGLLGELRALAAALRARVGRRQRRRARCARAHHRAQPGRDRGARSHLLPVDDGRGLYLAFDQRERA